MRVLERNIKETRQTLGQSTERTCPSTKIGHRPWEVPLGVVESKPRKGPSSPQLRSDGRDGRWKPSLGTSMAPRLRGRGFGGCGGGSKEVSNIERQAKVIKIAYVGIGIKKYKEH